MPSFLTSRPTRLETRPMLLLLMGLLLTTLAHAGRGPFPKKIRRVLFVGNSITYDGRYVTDIVAYLTARYPKQSIEFINVGLPSETVSGLSEEGHANGRFPRPDLRERLARVLDQTRPDLVFANYGMNDGIYQPLDDNRFRKFREGIHWLHDEVVKTGARIIHLTPPIYDEKKGGSPGYAAVLDRYADWLLSQRDSLKWEVIDVHSPMKIYQDERQRTEPDFVLAKDGVHPGDLGHWLMAKPVLLYLGEKQVAGADDVQAALASIPHGADVFRLVAERQAMMKDAWLTATGHKRPEMKVGLPLDQARLKDAELDRQIRALFK